MAHRNEKKRTGARRRQALRRAFRNPIEKIEQQEYSHCRASFKTGDILFFKGQSPLSWLIRVLTRSFYSHVGFIYWHSAPGADRRLYCIEAVGTGVRVILMSELKKRYRGGIDCYYVDREEPVKVKAVAFSFAQLGKLYDTQSLLRFFLAIVFGKVEQARQNDLWFCSELVAAAYATQGQALTPSTPNYTSAQDLADSEHVTYRFTVKHEA